MTRAGLYRGVYPIAHRAYSAYPQGNGDGSDRIRANQEADLSLIQPSVHPRVVELVRRCLVKDPKRRWHAAGDARVEIETILASPELPQSSAVERGPENPASDCNHGGTRCSRHGTG
jgi:hypothetical protein